MPHSGLRDDSPHSGANCEPLCNRSALISSVLACTEHDTDDARLMSSRIMLSSFAAVGTHLELQQLNKFGKLGAWRCCSKKARATAAKFSIL